MERVCFWLQACFFYVTPYCRVYTPLCIKASSFLFLPSPLACTMLHLILLLLPLASTQPLSPGARQRASSLDPEFILVAACSIASGNNDAKTLVCAECFEKAGDSLVSSRGLRQTRSCVSRHFPGWCGAEVGRLAVGDPQAEREAMACFLARVQREDSNDEVQDYVNLYLNQYD